jgi:predicted metal-dependent hydrolase
MPSGDQLCLFEERSASAGFEVRRSRRARRLSIRVFPHGRVEVVVPPRTRADEVERFVAGHRAWIERTLAAMAATGAAGDLAVPEWLEFPLAGESWRIVHRSGRRLRLTSRTFAGGGVIDLTAPEREGVPARRRLRAWVVEQGRRLLLPRLAALAARHDLVYARAGVGRQKTRWGSCSAAGAIRLNCSLLFLSPTLAEYVMLHELCHLRVLDHSPRFWRLLDSLQPGARALDEEMRHAWSRVPGWLHYDY